MASVVPVLSHLDTGFDGAIGRLFELLKIPSISTDSEYAEECVRAAAWLTEDLRSIGFDVKAYPTEGHPMVLGHLPNGEPSAPHVLFYGHYDVQPPDPLDLWSAEPFDPQLVKENEVDEGLVSYTQLTLPPTPYM